MDVRISVLGASRWEMFRDVRLAALEDSPSAFWSSHADEAAYGQREWTEFLSAATWHVAFLSSADRSVPTREEPIGMLGVLRRPELPAEPEIIGMWVAPLARRQGIAGRLLGEASARAAEEGACGLTLWILQHNDAAARLYSQRGFHFTGEQIALPRDPDIIELRMRKLLEAEHDARLHAGPA